MPLPKCTGPFTVGCFDLMTKSQTIPKDLTPSTLCDDDTDLGVFTRIYYPSHTNAAEFKEYKQSLWRPEGNIYIRALLSSVGIGWLSPVVKFFTRNVCEESFVDAPLIDRSSWQSEQQHSTTTAHPLVLFSHGLMGARFMYSTFCTQLASEGFIVAIAEHRDGSACATYTLDEEKNCVEIPYYHCDTLDDGDEEKLQLRNMQVNKRSVEMSKLLSLIEKLNTEPETINNILESKVNLKSFEGRIDTSRPFIMGHSFGGATTVQTINKDDRFKCGVGLDIWFPPVGKEVYQKESGLKKPILILYTEFFNWRKNLKRAYDYVDSQPKDYVEMITLKGTIHMDQCDIPGITPWYLSKYSGGHSSERMYFDVASNLQRKIISHYFGKYLKNKDYPVKLLSEEFTLPEEFIVGSNLKLKENEETEEGTDS